MTLAASPTRCCCCFSQRVRVSLDKEARRMKEGATPSTATVSHFSEQGTARSYVSVTRAL